MHIVTAGSEFLDIDAYAGCVAYAELLQLTGEPARAVSTAPLNESITQSLRALDAPLECAYSSHEDDVFTLIDVSIPEFLDPIVDKSRVVAVIDHHTGYETFWQERIGSRAQIEFIGAACTLVYERWQRLQKLDEMSRVSARLLIAGILDNTLNLQASVTTDRDRLAYASLLSNTGLTETWARDYFSECQQAIEADLPAAIINDTKTILNITNLPRAFGQLVVWDGQTILKNRESEIATVMSQKDADWGLNLVSIGERTSYFVSDNPVTQEKLGGLLGFDMSSGVAKTDKLWLRKEVLKAAKV